MAVVSKIELLAPEPQVAPLVTRVAHDPLEVEELGGEARSGQPQRCALLEDDTP